jgi:hypothetical protein
MMFLSKNRNHTLWIHLVLYIWPGKDITVLHNYEKNLNDKKIKAKDKKQNKINWLSCLQLHNKLSQTYHFNHYMCILSHCFWGVRIHTQFRWVILAQIHHKFIPDVSWGVRQSHEVLTRVEEDPTSLMWLRTEASVPCLMWIVISHFLHLGPL